MFPNNYPKKTLPGNREKPDGDATDVTSFAEAVADGATSSFSVVSVEGVC